MDGTHEGCAGQAMLGQLVAFLKGKLVKTAHLGPDGSFPALSETAERFNESSWFWTDDNAKAAELLCEPSLYDADPATADGAIDFVLRASQGEVIQRRCSPEELRVLSAEPASFRVETAFAILDGDLARGIVRHALRFNDGRTAVVAQHTGNVVSFRFAGRAVTLPVEPAITSQEVRVCGGAVVLSHTSTLRLPAAWRRPAAPVLGQLTYSYTVAADRPAIPVRVELVPAPGVLLQDVVLTAAVGELGKVPFVEYRTLAVRTGGQDRFTRSVPFAETMVHAGPAEYWVVSQEGVAPGTSYGVHAYLPDGPRLLGVSAQAQKQGKVRWVRSAYAVGTASGGKAVGVREERMLTGGGYYDALQHYETVLRDGVGGGYADPSMTYDIGSELNAVAAQILFASTGQYRRPPPAERVAVLRAWYDRHVQRYFAAVRPGEAGDLVRVYARGLAFVVLSLDCMLRATGDARYRAMLDTGVGLILRMQRCDCPRGVEHAVFVEQGMMPFLDGHAACMLALARAAWHGDAGGALSKAVHCGVLGLELWTGAVDLGGGHVEAYDGLAVTSPAEHGEHADTGFWTFKMGLVLRALHAARFACQAGVIGTGRQEAARIALRITIARQQVDAATRRHTAADGEVLEVLTSVVAGETNSETQPWAALGLVPAFDERIVSLGWCGRHHPA